jgi:hypothetical protein
LIPISSLFQKISKWQQALLIIWPIGLVFMHFCLFRIDNFEFSIGTTVCLTVVIYLTAYSQIQSLKYSYLTLVFLSCFFIYTLLLCSFADDLTEFLKSFIQVFVLLILLFLCIQIKLPHPKIIERSVNTFLILCVAVALLVVAQFIFLNVFDSYAIMKIYGPFSPLGPGYLVYEPHPLSLIRRPNGVFSEPSIAGWFLVFGLSVAVASPTLRKKNKYFSTIICGLGAIATLSISAITNILVLSLIHLWIRSKKVKRIYIHCGIILVVLFFLGWVTVKANITNRFGNIFVEGTSSYYRLNAPLKLLSESLRDYPFGHPLGQVNYILSKPYMINWELGSSVNIDNSFFMISYYYGIMGISISIIVLIVAAHFFLERSRSMLILAALLLSLAETGALWSPNIVLLIGYSIILIRFIRIIELQGSEHNKPTLF